MQLKYNIIQTSQLNPESTPLAFISITIPSPQNSSPAGWSHPSNLYAFFIRGGKILAVVFTTPLTLMKDENV